jgi:hypothetical protein
MMFASPYSSNWTSVVSPYEMPIRSGVCAKSRVGSDFVVVRICELFVRGDHCWPAEDRRHESHIKGQVKSARLKAAATNSTATSNSTATATLAAFSFSIFAFPFSAFNSSEVKNETLQH